MLNNLLNLFAYIFDFIYGKSFYKYIKKHPDMTKKQLVLIRPAYIRHWRRLARDPIHTAGFLFMKVCEFAAGGVGLVVSEVKR